MFVSVIFDVEYFGRDERHKWFLKNVSHAKENDLFIITHETLVKNYRKYVENCSERFWDEFEMKRLTEDEYNSLSIGGVDDSLFDELEAQFGSRTEMLSFLFNNNYKKLEEILCEMIEQEMKERNDDAVEGIFTCLDAFKTIRTVAQKYNCPVIEYIFSALRKVHGYRETLYVAEIDGDLRSSNSARRGYRSFQKNNDLKMCLSKRELLALFGKRKNIPLLKLINVEGEHELGLCKMPWGIAPQLIGKLTYTDVDLYCEAKERLNTKDIVVREHPNILWNNTSIAEVKEHTRNDPISFILGCKRIACVESQIGLKALLWNRSVYCKEEFAVFSWIGEENIESLGKADDMKLNYFMIAYLVPSKYMFDVDYWRWRVQSNPTEFEIYMKHFSYYAEQFNLDLSEMSKMVEKERFAYILQKRDVDQSEIDSLLEENDVNNIDFEVIFSKLKCRSTKELLCINQKQEGMIKSCFVFEKEEDDEEIEFYPFVDVAGFFQLNEYFIDEKRFDKNENCIYLRKNDGKYVFSIEDLEVGVHTMEIYWEYFFS